MRKIRTRITRGGLGMTAVAVATAWALLLSPVTPARGEGISSAFEAVPAGADIIFVIPNLSKASGKISALNKTLGLNVPEMDDLLGKIKAEAGATNGMDDNGAALIVLTDVSNAIMGGQDPPMLALVPVTDYNAFVGNYNVVTEDGGDISAIIMPDGQPAFARPAGEYAVLSPLRAAVETYQPGDSQSAKAMIAKLGKLGGKTASGADALAYFDLEAMAPTLIPLIDQGMAEMNQELDQMAQFGMDATTIKTQKDMMAMYAGIGKMILRDASAGIIGADLTDKGNGMTFAVQFKPDATLGKMFPGGGGSPNKMLTDLPNRPYIFAMAMNAKSINTELLADEILKLMPAEDAADPGMLAAYRDSIPMIKGLRGAAAAFYAPQADGAMGVLNILQIAYVDNGKAYLDVTKKQLQAMNGLAMPMGPDGEMTFTTTYDENAMEIDGVQVDQYQVTMNLPPEMMQQMAPMMMLMGGSGYGGYIAAKDNAVVTTMVTDPNLITAGLKSLGSGNGLGADTGLAKLRKEALPNPLAMEGYFSFTGIGQLANQFLPMVGMQPINIPADLPPIAMGASIEDSGLSFRYYVPNTTIKFLVDEGKKLQGGAGGGGGGPPPF